MAFQSYRVVHKIHLGGIEQVLDVENIVQFNGLSLKTEDGTEIKLAQPSAISGAIKVGWLVPISSEERTFTPKSAGVQVHSAKAVGEKRVATQLMTVLGEEQNLGARQEIRRTNNNPQKQSSEGEGIVVSRMKTSAKSAPIEIGTEDREVLAKIDKQGLPIEKVRSAKPTGDVFEALAGDELEDILPEAVSTRLPDPASFRNEGVKTNSGASQVGGQEEGVVIGKVGAPRPNLRVAAAPAVKDTSPDDGEVNLPEDNVFREKALRRWAQSGKTWNGQPVSLADLSLMVLSVLNTLDKIRSAPSDTPQAPSDTSQAPPVPVTQGIPLKVEWDLNPHWKTRQANLSPFKENPQALREIYAVENSGGVKNMIEALIKDLGQTL